MPLFSVIIPVYNKETYIEDCLNSVLNQSFSDFEIVITNDGSTDKSLDKIKSFRIDKLKILNQENLGVSLARNNAAKKANGIYLAFLDADDIWKENHLETLYDSIKKYPDTNFFANNYLIKYNSSVTRPAKLNLSQENSGPYKVADFFNASLSNTIVWTSAACIRRDSFFRYGEFNPEYTTGQDLDLWIRIVLNESVVFNPKKTMIYNYTITNSLSKSEHNQVRLALFSSFKVEEEKNSSLKKYLDIKRYGLAIRTKINGEKSIFEQALRDISPKNLNRKQWLMLKTPKFILKEIYRMRPYLLKNSVYLRLFKS